jgi:transcriptional regulator with XRE-family HTH domain
MKMNDNDIAIIERFSRNVRTLRDQAGVSQEKLAALSGLHRTYIGSLERGEKVPSLLTIVKIASALNVTESQLID